MKLAIHAGTLRGAGSAAVGQGIVRALAELAGPALRAVWIPRAWGWGDDVLPPHVEVHRLSAGLANKVLAENVSMRRTLTRGVADRLFALGDSSIPACPVPQLLLVQQLFLGFRPAELGFPMPRRWRLKMELMQRYFALGLGSASMLTVQTEHMRERLVARWKIAPQRVVVVPSAVEIESAAEVQRVPVDEPHAAPYVCYVAAPGPHKNHRVLAEMMADLARAGVGLRCKLTASAHELPELLERARALGVVDRFDLIGRVDRARLRVLYSEAVALVMPSLLESFGLPLYEAMALGCPIVASDLPFTREACGDAALYADAHSGVAFASQLRRLRDEPTLAQQLSEAGRARYSTVARSWLEIGRAYLELLEQLEPRT